LLFCLRSGSGSGSRSSPCRRIVVVEVTDEDTEEDDAWRANGTESRANFNTDSRCPGATKAFATATMSDFQRPTMKKTSKTIRNADRRCCRRLAAPFVRKDLLLISLVVVMRSEPMPGTPFFLSAFLP
jgi:hypothetical protein